MTRSRKNKSKSKKHAKHQTTEHHTKVVEKVVEHKPAHKPKHHAKESKSKLSPVEALGLLPTSMAGAFSLLQPDKAFARSGLGVVANFPGQGIATSGLRLRGLCEVEMPAGSQALIVAYPNSGFGYTIGGGAITEIGANLGVALIRPSSDPSSTWPAFRGTTGTLDLPSTWTLVYFPVQDGSALFSSAINDEWPILITGGDVLAQFPATYLSQALVVGMKTWTGSAGLLHTMGTTADLRSRSRGWEMRQMSTEDAGFNIRYTGSMLPMPPQNIFRLNNIFTDTDELSTAAFKSTLNDFRDQLVDFLKQRNPNPDSLPKFEVALPAANESPSAFSADSVIVALIHNASSTQAETFELIVDFDIQMAATNASGLPREMLPHDPNWAEVLNVSDQQPFIVGLHSFGDFFKQLWGGVKTLVSSVGNKVLNTASDVAKGAAQAAAGAAMGALRNGVPGGLPPIPI